MKVSIWIIQLTIIKFVYLFLGSLSDFTVTGAIQKGSSGSTHLNYFRFDLLLCNQSCSFALRLQVIQRTSIHLINNQEDTETKATLS